MVTNTKSGQKAEIYNRSFRSEPSIGIVLAGVFGLLGIVFLVLQLSEDPKELSKLPEETYLAGFTWVPNSGPWLGVDVKGDGATRFPGFTNQGRVSITRVMIGSPAQRAGLRNGDVIERIDNSLIGRPLDLHNVIGKHQVGDSIMIVIQREEIRRTVSATLGSRPVGNSAPGVLAAQTTPGGKPWFGADIQPIDKFLAGRLNLTDTRGIIVSYVYPNSPADKIGLVQGDVIRRVGEVRISSIDQFSMIIGKSIPGDMLKLRIQRNRSVRDVNLTLALRPPPEVLPAPTLPEAVVEIEAAWLSMDIAPLTKAEAEEMGIKGDLKGMVVSAVSPGRGMDSGFQIGDVIIAINGKTTETTTAFQDATEGAVGALVDVIRGGRHVYISVPPQGKSTGIGQDGPPIQQVMFGFK